MTTNEQQQFWNEFAQRWSNEWARDLSQLLRFDTVSGDPDPRAYEYWRSRIAEGFEFLYQRAKDFGFVTRYYDKRVLVIERPGPTGAPVLGFPIHLDVVPAGEGWTYKPFGGEIVKGAIWGRGAQDDKGPIIQCLYALLGAVEFASECNIGFRKTVRIIVVSEEELGVWDDIPFYFEREKPPDFSIVPDAHFPITNGEKGFVNVQLKVTWKTPVTGTFSIHSGERSNVVPSKAVLKIGVDLAESEESLASLATALKDAPRPPEIGRVNGAFDVLCHGVGSHGSTPAKGYNAATDALRLAASIQDIKTSPVGIALHWVAEAAASLDGKFLGIDRFHEKVGHTTVNLGVLRVNETSLEATLNIRNAFGITCEEVESAIKERAAKLQSENADGFQIEATMAPGSREPIYVDPEAFSKWIDPMRESYKATTGREAGLQSIGGTTFAKAFPNAVCFGPVDPVEEDELAHEADEHVTLDAMRRNVEIYGRSIIGIALKD